MYYCHSVIKKNHNINNWKSNVRNSNFIVGKPKIQIRLFNKFSKKEFLDGFLTSLLAFLKKTVAQRGAHT